MTPFRLNRYFSITSGIAVVVMLLVFATFYHSSEVREHTDLAGRRSDVLARAFANVIWPEFGAELTTRATGMDAQTLRDWPVTERLHTRLKEIGVGVPMIKIKIYNLKGIAVYSSVPAEIGEDKSQNIGFIAAREGTRVNGLTHRGQISATEGEIRNVDVVESYIPVQPNAAASIEAVFEMYTDITETVADISRATYKLLAGLVFSFAIFYAVLLLIVRRADRILQRQYSALKASEDRARTQNLDLEREIGERRLIEEALRRSEEKTIAASRAKSDFLSNMSHELRTPMNAILGFAQILRTEPAAPLSANQDKFVNQILKAGAHLLALINQVLDLSRIEAGKMSMSLESVNIEDLTQECIPLIQNMATRRGIAIVARNEAAMSLHVTADRFRLKQVLLNVLSNAVKYNRDGGQVSLQCTTMGNGRVRIKVNDTGHGIAQDQLAGLFEPFNRLGAEATEVEGTGIGLALSRQLVELMHGEMGCESVAGAGSTFWIDLPAGNGDVEVAPQGTDAAATNAQPRGELTLLYIEDNPANVMLMEVVAARIAGTRLLTAHTAELGIELALMEHPDLIIIDINLPGIDGYEALRRVQALPQITSTPVMALSANASPNDIERGKQAGFVRYETKPIDIQSLIDAIHSILGAEELQP
jgi:signal transduction histidine kinase